MSGESIVHNILKKASCRLKFLYRYSNILNLKSRKTLCFALIQCHFDYSSSSWYSGINKDLKQRLQIMQNKMIRYILNLNSRSHLACSEFEKLDMLNVSDRVKQNKLNHVHRIWNRTGPHYMRENFDRLCDIEIRNCTRASANNFFLPRVKQQGTNTFFYSGIKDWNSLPASIKQIKEEGSFRNRVKMNIVMEARKAESCPFVFFK